jgi:putative PIG3 family NAD(P)H quinone oxidoreductase
VRAIQVVNEGRDARLVLGDAPEPKPGPNEVAIAVCATAVNRADLLQRRGLYPPPPGASPILGLECAGRIDELGSEVRGFERGERVMALLPGGGYAERVCVDAGSLMRIPERLDFAQAAAVPEVFLTCDLNLFQIAGARAGEFVLVHGGGSGIGTTAIQLLRQQGARVIVTAGSAAKCERCLALGAERAIDYKAGEFAAAVLEHTDGQGAHVVLDSIGAAYLEPNLRCLRSNGRLVLIGTMSGARSEIDLSVLMRKRLTIVGSTLRARSAAEKAAITRAFVERFGAALASGAVAPVVDEVLPLAEAQRAHERLERSDHFGKLVLRVAG